MRGIVRRGKGADAWPRHSGRVEQEGRGGRAVTTGENMTDEELIALAQEAGFPTNTQLSGNVLIAGHSKRRFRRLVEIAQERERKACITAINAADDCDCGMPCDCFSSGSAVWAIKERSNVKLTGSR
jgi:hypothetical protein